MTQGIWDANYRPIPTKKALREAIKEGKGLYLEATSIFGNEYDGPLSEAPAGSYWVVGPDPRRDRRWFAQIDKTDKGMKVK